MSESFNRSPPPPGERIAGENEILPKQFHYMLIGATAGSDSAWYAFNQGADIVGQHTVEQWCARRHLRYGKQLIISVPCPSGPPPSDPDIPDDSTDSSTIPTYQSA